MTSYIIFFFLLNETHLSTTLTITYAYLLTFTYFLLFVTFFFFLISDAMMDLN